MNKYELLTPFKWCVIENFPFIEADFDAITNYQLLQKIVAYLNKTIDKTNFLGTEVEKFYNYFNTLDVQDEINKKLDSMAESGELTEIISKYITPYLNNFDERLLAQDRKIASIENITPQAVASIDAMTDQNKIYVNTTDGYWYFYNGSAWTRGGLFQATSISQEITDGVQIAYDTYKKSNKDWILNTMSLTRESINLDYGSIVSDQGGKRLRTGRLNPLQRGQIAKMTDSRYLIAPRYYFNVGNLWEEYYVEGRDWGTQFYAGLFPYVAFIFRKADDTEITDEDIQNIRNGFELSFLTDETLSTQGVPADAKAVGDAINSVFNFKDYQSGRINFNIEINSSVLENDKSDSINNKTVKGVLMLPTTYKKSGNKTPLIMCCHGASGVITDNTWYNSSWLSLMQTFLDNGYAVFDTNRLPESENGYGKTYGSPVALNALYNAYKYLIKNYNLEEKILVHGTSMGGVTAQEFSYMYPNIVKAVSCFAPANNLYSIWRSGTSIREETEANYIANCFGYNTRQDAKNDGYKNFIGFSSALRIQRFNINNELINTNIVDLENSIENNANGGFWFNNNEKRFLKFPVPIKIWNATNDESVQPEFNECLIDAIRNAGGIGFIKNVNGSHSDISYGTVENMRTEVITWFNRFK